MADHLAVIRAGATEYDLEGRIRGTLDLPLATEGVAEAELAADLLAANPPVALFSSDDMPSLETARIVARRWGGKPRTLAGLHNIDQGLWQGMLVEELRRKQPRLHRQWTENPWAVAPPNGELVEEACDRLESCLERVVRRHPAGRVALVLPRPLDRLAHWLLSGELPGDLWAVGRPCPAVVTVPLAAQWGAERRRVPVA
jgi:broad specificity phosphatase PhoE